MWRRILIAKLLLMTCAGSALGQPGTRTVPRQDYYLTFSFFYDGNMRTAIRGFRSAGRSGIRSSEGRWVDSICYHAMLGECYYQQGNLGLALEQFDSAARLFVAHQRWLLRIDFPQLQAAQRQIVPAVNWGRPKRNIQFARIPDTMSSLQGNTRNDLVVRQGGVVSAPQLFPIGVAEIVRCTALTIRRRHDIMGVTCKHSPLTKQIVEALTARQAPQNHWSQSWIDAQLGMALAAAGQKAEAVRALQKSLLVLGQLDHNLTAMALVELGKLAFAAESYDNAANYFLEATYSAAFFGQYGLMEEAFRWGTMTHMASGKDGLYPPLQPAAEWARRNSRMLEASVLQNAGENLAMLGNPTQAKAMLDRSLRAMRRADIGVGEIGYRLRYTNALVAYQTGNTSGGDKLFADVMKYQRKASLRLFRIGLADKLYVAGAVSERVAGELFKHVLREPTAKDWLVAPRDNLAVLLTPHELPMEHWFEVSIKRKDEEMAQQVADQVKRHRFYSTLPMGGRLLSLRWILESSEQGMAEAAQLQRRDLLAQFPAYAELSKQEAKLRQQLALPEAEQATETVRKAYQQLASIGEQKEKILRQIAVRRQPADTVFPPTRTIKEIQAGLPVGTVVLSYFATSRYVYAFAYSRDQYSHWSMGSPRRLQAATAAYLRQLGHVEKNAPIDKTVLADPKWKEISGKMLTLLTNEAPADSWKQYEELVVVPDGDLWYVPFESLVVNDEPLIKSLRVRYSPLAATILPDGRPQLPDLPLRIAAGKLFPRDDDKASEQAVDKLVKNVANAERLSAPANVPGHLVAPSLKHILAWKDLEEVGAGNSYAWAPLSLEKRKRAGDDVGAWLGLPFGAPQVATFPGFNSAAASGLRRSQRGREIFNSVMALLASGSRTVMLSRWRTGGESSRQLMEQYTSEAMNDTAARGWQKAVLATMEKPLQADLEPRVKSVPEGENKLSHPFFWAGYVLVDTAQRKEDKVPQFKLPAAKPKAGEQQ